MRLAYVRDETDMLEGANARSEMEERQKYAKKQDK